MDWNIIESTMPFIPLPESSLTFLYNHNDNYPYPGMEVSQAAFDQPQQISSLPGMDERNNGNNYGVKKRKLTTYQVDSLERSFQEEIKLGPERKMKLSIELGLQPRQIAVWFQNRRTRWKTKQLENLYDELKQKNQKLQEEVMELKEKLKEQDNIRTQTFREEPVESTLETLRWREIEGGIHDPCWIQPQGTTSSIQQVGEGYNNNSNSSFIYEDYDSFSMLHECHWPDQLPY